MNNETCIACNDISIVRMGWKLDDKIINEIKPNNIIIRKLVKKIKTNRNNKIFNLLLNCNNYGSNDIISFDGYEDIKIVIMSEPLSRNLGYNYKAMLLYCDNNAELEKIPINTCFNLIGILVNKK